MLGHVVVIALDQAVQTLVEEQIGTRFQIFPGRELATLAHRVQAHALTVMRRFLVIVQVIASLTGTALAVAPEQRLEGGKIIGFRAKVAEEAVALVFRYRHCGLELDTIQTVKTVALDDRGIDLFSLKNVLKGFFDR